MSGNSANTELQGYMLDIERSIQTFGWLSDEVLYMIRLQQGDGLFNYTLPNFDDGRTIRCRGLV